MKIGIDSNVLVASIKKRAEPYHEEALELAHRIRRVEAFSVASALALLEVPGALASSTSMPTDKIYEALLSVQEHFRLSVMAYESYVERAKELIFEFRELKSKREIGSADFHHLATCIEEGCAFFVTTDERHLLRDECRGLLNRSVRILDPREALVALSRIGMRGAEAGR